MNCDKAKKRLADRGDIEIPDIELKQHLEKCDECHEFAVERQLVTLLASLPVRQPGTDFEDRVMRRALSGAPAPAGRIHARWALATAASVILAVLLTLQFQPPGSGTGTTDAISPAVVEVRPQEPRVVDILLTSRRALDDALIRVHLDENLALEGYEGTHDLQWRTSLKSGNNKLSLPIRLVEGKTGMLTVIVEHGGASKRFPVTVNAVPADGRKPVSMI